MSAPDRPYMEYGHGPDVESWYNGMAPRQALACESHPWLAIDYVLRDYRMTDDMLERWARMAVRQGGAWLDPIYAAAVTPEARARAVSVARMRRAKANGRAWEADEAWWQRTWCDEFFRVEHERMRPKRRPFPSAQEIATAGIRTARDLRAYMRAWEQSGT